MRVIKVDRCGYSCPYFSDILKEYDALTTEGADLLCTYFTDENGDYKRIKIRQKQDFPKFCKLEDYEQQGKEKDKE